MSGGRIGGMSAARLTSTDPEPPIFTVVRDDLGQLWRRWPEGYWLREDVDSDDPKSWNKVAGNYGPVDVVWSL